MAIRSPIEFCEELDFLMNHTPPGQSYYVTMTTGRVLIVRSVERGMMEFAEVIGDYNPHSKKPVNISRFQIINRPMTVQESVEFLELNFLSPLGKPTKAESIFASDHKLHELWNRSTGLHEMFSGRNDN